MTEFNDPLTGPVPPESEPEAVSLSSDPDVTPTETETPDDSSFDELTPGDFGGNDSDPITREQAVTAFNNRELPEDHDGSAVMRSVTGYNPPED